MRILTCENIKRVLSNNTGEMKYEFKIFGLHPHLFSLLTGGEVPHGAG